jgi:ClpP class serine protease
MRAFEIITAVPWAMTEPALQHLLQVYETAIERKAAGMPLDRQAIAAEVGKPLDNTFVVTVRDGVAVIPVEGPIFRHANLMTDLSGATSLEMLALDFRQALANPAVHSILLDVDSPGGEANGVNEFSEMLYAARGQKPIVAYVSDTGASAAYWIASACDEIICDATAMLGSIGVVAAVPDPAARKARDIEFVSSQSPNKRPDVTTERGKAQIQVIVDSLAEIFIGAVARNRGVTPNTVQSDFGQGGVLVGQQAVAAGLADRLGSFEQVVAELQARHDEQARAERGAWSRMPSGTTEGSMKLFSPEWWTNMITGAQQAESLAPMSEAERNVPHAHVDKAPQAGTDTGAPAEAVPGAAELVAPIRGMTLMCRRRRPSRFGTPRRRRCASSLPRSAAAASRPRPRASPRPRLARAKHFRPSATRSWRSTSRQFPTTPTMAPFSMAAPDRRARAWTCSNGPTTPAPRTD